MRNPEGYADIQKSKNKISGSLTLYRELQEEDRMKENRKNENI